MKFICDSCGVEEHHDDKICAACGKPVILSPEMKRLNELLTTMDVPKSRFSDMRWLAHNLGIRNEQHPNFAEARRLIVDAWKKSRSI